MNAKKCKMLRREIQVLASAIPNHVKPNGLKSKSSYNVPYVDYRTGRDCVKAINHPTKVNTPFSIRGEYRKLKKEMRSFT